MLTRAHDALMYACMHDARVLFDDVDLLLGSPHYPIFRLWISPRFRDICVCVDVQKLTTDASTDAIHARKHKDITPNLTPNYEYSHESLALQYTSKSRILRQQSLGQWFKTLFVRTISTLPFFALSILLLSPLFGLSRSFNIAS